jgi:RHS repeat-associated protein
MRPRELWRIRLAPRARQAALALQLLFLLLCVFPLGANVPQSLLLTPEPVASLLPLPDGRVIREQGPFPWADPPQPAGRLIGRFYDAQGREFKTISDLNGDGSLDSSDIVTLTEYDLAGNPIRVTDPLGRVTRTEYDKANRPVVIHLPPVRDAEEDTAPCDSVPPPLAADPQLLTAYDKVGNVLEQTDARGVASRFEYDELNRPTSEKRALGTPEEVETTTVYDEHGNVTQRILHNRAGGVDEPQVTFYEYDPFDRQVQVEWPDGALDSTAYYRDGKVKLAMTPMGQAAEYQYDAARRLRFSRHRDPNGTLEETRWYLSYDLRGHLLAVSDLNQVEEPVLGSLFNIAGYAYDALGRLTGEGRLTEGEPVYGVESEYDLEGNRTRVVYPSGRELVMTYDKLGRLESVKDLDDQTATWYEYDKAGNLIRQSWPQKTNPVLETLSSYDAQDRLEETQTTSSGTEVYKATYAYDLAGNIRRLKEKTAGVERCRIYDYDDQYRLTGESWGSGAQAYSYSYTYDLAGNRLSQVATAAGVTQTSTYTYSIANALVALDVQSGGTTHTDFDYDLNGSLVAKQVTGGAQTTYTWDASKRLVSASVNGAEVFSARYDYRTRRLKKTESGSATYFLYDGGVSIAERQSGTWNTKAEFGYGLGLGAGIGGIVFDEEEETKVLSVYNHVGHTVVRAHTSGAIQAWNVYEAFGNRVSYYPPVSPTNRLANTRELDGSLGLYNHGFRYYDPVVGRYIARDPAGYADGLHLYLYVHNNPVTGVDILGLIERRELYAQYHALLRQARHLENAIAEAGDLAKPYSQYMAAQTRLVRDSAAFLKEQWWTSAADVDAAGLHMRLPTVFLGIDAALAAEKLRGDHAAANREFGGQVDSTISTLGTQIAVAQTVETTGTVITIVAGAGATAMLLKEAGKQGLKQTAKVIGREVAEEVVQSETGLPVGMLRGRGARKGEGSIYRVPGEGTPSGKPYIGRHNKPDPAKTRRSNDGRDRTQAEVIDTYDPKKSMEGRRKEQQQIDRHGGVENLDNKRNEIRRE